MENTTLKLSIITVNLNNAEGLRKTIDSVINQTYTNFEHIIIDGGSTDGSVEVIKEYEAIYKDKQRHLYWVSEPDKGIYNGMNKGIEGAKGEYCLFLNSGDELHSESTILDAIKHFEDGRDIIYGDIIYKHSKTNTRYIKSESTVSLSLFEKNSLPHPASFFKKTLFDEYGLYNENHKVVSDYEFFLKVYIHRPEVFKHIPLPISIFDMNGISSDPSYKQLRDHERLTVQISFFPQCVWNELANFNILERKYYGLLSSNSVKVARKVSKYLKKIFLNKDVYESNSHC